MNVGPGGVVIAALALVGLWFGIRRLRRLGNAVRTLRGKVVVITGASSGLGEACAQVFYDAGCKLILCARRITELERVKLDLEVFSAEDAAASRVKIVTFDLADLSNINAAMLKVLACYGHIDIVINNGGLSYRGSIEETSLDVDVAVMNVNYFGQVAVTKALLPHMLKRQSGHIVAIGSIQSKLALPFRSAYGASKHALQSFFDSLRAEVAGRGVQVSVIHPGYISTSLSLNAMTAQGSSYGKMDETQASGMSAEDVARRVLNAVALQQKEVLIAPLVHRVVTYLRNVMPDTLCREMARRAARQMKASKKSS